jgi:hypothetical protein
MDAKSHKSFIANARRSVPANFVGCGTAERACYFVGCGTAERACYFVG